MPTMLVESNNIIPITKLQKELTQTVRELSDTGEPVFILKNNNMEAVMLTFDEYKHLSDLEEMFEYFEIKDMLDSRLSAYRVEKNVDWKTIKE
jgi:PHD/YefM family antitoxin component YafN of YafNO toxin-antitoxin module